MAFPAEVRIREVGPRDGFQNEREVIATADKIRLIELLARTGVRRLEITSFVRPDVIPQLADAGAVLAAIDVPEGVARSVLIPNEAGFDRALALRDRFDEINCFLSASESHNEHNVRRSVEESLRGLEQVIPRARAEGLRVEAVISVVFGCPYEGVVPFERVLAIAERLVAAGAQEVGFGDTTGMANPISVRERLGAARERLGDSVELTAHFHNTRGQGLANVLAALEVGCTSFESSFGELGGCPVPPGATGNIATEDLVSMLEEMGIATGISLEAMLAAAAAVRDVLGRPLGSHTLVAGPIDWASLMFERVLIANRGEIAVRIARTLRRLGCSPAVVFVPGDAAWVALADPDAAVEVDSYLGVEAIVAAALRSGAQAIHPAYGFLSENPALAAACEQAGLVWIGPPAPAIELMGDKAAARAAAQRAGVPVVPGIDDPSPASLARFAADHGLPLLIKAARGGGGKGMRLVSELGDVEAALAAARREVAAAFGDDHLLVERYISPARHLEVQVLADRHGTVIDLGERECSLQRRHQKVVEEAPSPAVDDAVRRLICERATALARGCGYVGAGTVEFVALADHPEEHYFLEMNTRLQVEHAVTEAVHGIDLVEWQLRIAAGEALAGLPPREPTGHAIEARVYAEDPARGFLPATGTVRALRFPEGPAIRVDSGIRQGSVVGTSFDPMLAKVVAHAPSRGEALAQLDAALAATTILGVRTNLGFLRRLLADPRVGSGAIDTALVEQLDPTPSPGRAARAALVAQVAQGLSAPRDDGDVFAALPGWRLAGAAAPVGHRYTVDGEHEVEVALGSVGEGGTAVTAQLDGVDCTLELLADEHEDGGVMLRLAIDGLAERWLAVAEGEDWLVGSAGAAWRVSRRARELGVDSAGESEVRAPMPGSVVAVHASDGAEVERGAVLLVMESMKMELQITAPRAGTVVVHVAPGDQVALDEVLASVAAATVEQAA